MSHKSAKNWIPPKDRAELCARAKVRVAQASEPAALSRVWHELVSGTATVVDEFFTTDRCGLLLIRDPARRREPLAGRRLHVLELLLTGSCQKNIAIDLALAPSTVALHAQRALRHLGAASRPSRVHPTLMLIAMAALGGTAPLAAVRASFEDGDNLEVIGMARPDAGMESVLPRAQLAVTRHLVEGSCYERISAERGTSQRTIANQIATVFRRLKVSGRSELLQRLISWQPDVDLRALSNDRAVHV